MAGLLVVTKPLAMLGIVLATSLAVAGAPAGGVDFDAVRSHVIPAVPEPWETIPWRTDLESARREAAREGKLLFMWSMNGHPLGCT